VPARPRNNQVKTEPHACAISRLGSCQKQIWADQKKLLKGELKRWEGLELEDRVEDFEKLSEKN